jgi:hypothetical protein
VVACDLDRGGAREPLPQARVHVQRLNSVGVCVGRIALHDETSTSIGHHFEHARNCRNHNRKAACLRLQHGQGQAFMCGRQHEHISRTEQIRHVRPESKEPHELFDAEFSREGPEIVLKLTPFAPVLADEPALDWNTAPGEHTDGSQSCRLALVGREVCRHEHDEAIGGKTNAKPGV